MIKFIIALLFLLIVAIIAGMVRKLRGGTFLPQPERDEDRLFIDKRGRWWRDDPQSGALEEPYGRRPKNASLCDVRSCASLRSGSSWGSSGPSILLWVTDSGHNTIALSCLWQDCNHEGLSALSFLDQ